jgi:membrane protein
MQDVMHRPHNGLLSLGFIVTVWAASGGMNMTLSAMDRCYDLPKGRPFYKQRLLAIVLTLVAAILSLAVLVLLPIGALAERWVEQQHMNAVSALTLFLWTVTRYLLAIVLMFTLVSIVHHFGPSIKQDFHPITPGSVFTVAVWLLLEALFRLYVDKFGKYDQTYGAVGGVAILLLFFYIDAVVLLIGAEINSEFDFAKGIPRGTYDFRESATVRFAEPESSEDDGEDGVVEEASPERG